MESSDGDSRGTSGSSKKGNDSHSRTKRSLLEVWRFFHQAFLNVHSSENDPKTIVDFFNIINSVFKEKDFSCYQFASTPFQKANDEPNLTDYVLWVSGQCFQILVSPELNEYSPLATECYKTFLNFSLSRNSSVFNAAIAEHFRLMFEFIKLYRNFIKNKESFTIKAFSPTQIEDIVLNNCTVIYITEFKIDSHKIALNVMKHFILILDSCKELSCYEPQKLLYVLKQLVESCKEIRNESLHLAVYLISDKLKFTISRVSVNYWLSHLIQHSLTDLSVAPCFNPLISWLIQNDPSKKLDEVFHSLAYIICEYIEKEVTDHQGLTELCGVSCLLLKNINLDIFTETLIYMVKYSTKCTEIFRVASEYLKLSVKFEKRDSDDASNTLRGIKRKRCDVGGKFQNAVWDEMILCVLESLEVYFSEGFAALHRTCSLVSYLTDLALDLSAGHSDHSPLLNFLYEKIERRLLLFFELAFKRCSNDIHLVNLETSLLLLNSGAHFFQIVSANITPRIIGSFNDLYASIYSALTDNPSASIISGCDKKGLTNLYQCYLELFVFYVQLPYCQQDVVDLMWPCLIRQNSCRTIFKESFVLLILATCRITLQESLIENLVMLLQDDCIVDSIQDVKFAKHLLCLTSSTCYLQRNKYAYEVICSTCDVQESENRHCQDFSNRLDGFKRKLETKYMEMISVLNPNMSLLKNYSRYAKHLTRPKISFFKHLYSSSASVRFEVYLTFKDILADKSGVILYDVKAAVSVIFNLMNTEEFSKGGHLTKLLFQLVNLLAMNEQCFMLSWKMIFYFLATSMNFDSMRITDSLQCLVLKHDTTLIETLQKYKDDFSMILELLIINNVETCRWSLSKLIESVKDVFDFDDGKTFLKSFCLPTLLPHLFLYCPGNLLFKVFNELADYLETSLKEMVVTYFDDIYTEFWFGSLVNGQKRLLVDLFNKLEACSGCSIQSLVSHSNEMLICKFMLNADHPSILVAIKFLFLRENETLHSILCSNMLGCLTYIDICLQSRESSQLILNKCLKCLPQVITLLGPTNVTNMRFKLLSTLTSSIALHPNINPQLYFDTWFSFLCSVNLRLIGPSLGSIFSSLVPLVDKVPQVADLLTFISITFGELFVEFLPDLYFLEDSKQDKMHQIYVAIQNSLVKSQGDYKEEISRIIRHIGSKDTSLKLHSLNRLLELLKKHSTDLHLLIVKSDQLHPLIVKIIDCLMKVLRDSNAAIRNACAACIGELGAIDPGRFSYKLNQQALNKKLICEINSVEFAHLCVCGLIQGLQQNSKNLQAFNKFVGAIQETLKLYFMNDQSQVCKKVLFDKFAPSVREMLETLLAVHYPYMVPDINKFNVPHPIFGSKRGSTVEDWVYSWSVKLISFLNDRFDADLLIGCAPCMNMDIQFAITLLPYILLQALVRCNEEQRQMIEEEVKAVLHWKVYSSHQHGISHIWKRIGACSDTVSPMFGDRSLESSRCIGIIFDLFNFLYKYATDSRIAQDNGADTVVIQSKVKDFLGNFPHKSLFVQAYVQKDYCRSLWHIEKSLTKKKLSEDTLKQLRNIYSKINDADGLVGVMGSFEKTPTTEESVLCHVVRGNLMDALNGYRVLADKHSNSNFFQRVLIRCYLSVDQPSTALQITRAITAAKCPSAELFNEHVESLWTTLETDEMESLLSKFDPEMKRNWCWGINVGQILSDIEHNRPISQLVSTTRQKLVDILASLSQDKHVAYHQGYQYILKLHILNELEKFAEVFDLKRGTAEPLTSFNTMDLNMVTGRPMQLRLALLTPNAHDLHQVLKIRRVSLSIIEKKASLISPASVPIIHKELSNILIKNLRIARKSGNTDGAAVYISMAEQYPPVGVFVEKAKLLNARNQPDAAVVLLRQGITQYFTNSTESSQHKSICAKAKLLIAQYNDENIKVDVKDGAKYYKESLDVCPWEKAYIALARYLYRSVTSDVSNSLSPEDIVRMEYETAYYFGMAMMCGSKYIYQSMPCMLSLWLDFISRMVRTAGNQQLNGLNRMAVDNVNNFNQMIGKFSDVLPAYMFMTAFSQLISRMGHPYEPSFQIIKKIIVKMIITFPHQACWTFVSTIRSPHPLHKKRSLEILKDPNILTNSSLNNFIEHFKDLVSKMICLSLKDTRGGKKCVPLEFLVKGLKELLRSPIEIMVPAQCLRSVALPYSKFYEATDTSNKNYNPFPENLVYFYEVRDEVEILQSLQMPKKVVFTGSDGVLYPLICKMKDDLRIDSIIMEFNSIANMYLRRDPKTREQNLLIRTYSVVPLSMQCGIIEFIPNLVSLKLAVNQMLKKKGLYEVMNEIHKFLSDRKMTKGYLAEKRLCFSMNLMKYPSVLQDWFFDHFQNPQTWYLARRGFIRTAAVMSIVGYMEGLGDRHCENILIDTASGDLVHVDFNCLFNKAEAFLFPEFVPFRLTQNMLSAMGPTGYEGTFVRSCEETTRVMRKFSDHLVATLKPFLHDPKIFEQKKEQQFEYNNETAKSHIDNVQKRLTGVVMTKTRFTHPLSVEGQVRLLIAEAVNVDNLAQMFPGWTPHI